MFYRDMNCGPQVFHFVRRFGGPSGFAAAFSRGFGGPRGGGFRFGRMIRDGELRLVALSLLEEGPRHGYDIIKALEERSNGFYSPSPGVVYPTLTYLEEAGYASATAEGNKKVYAITDAGRAYLAENRDAVKTIFAELAEVGAKMSKAREWFDWTEEREVREEREVSESDAEPTSGARGELERARRRLRALILAATEGTDDDQRRVADALNRAADEILGRRAGS